LSKISRLSRTGYQKNEKASESQNKEAVDHASACMKSCIRKMSELDHPRDTETDRAGDLIILKDLNLLTVKPVIFVCNISEDELT
jgi:ribosome-binding ATPase YchF (GTP1/OBG family)